MSAFELTALAASLGAGLAAGLCLTFGSFVLRALESLGAPAAIRAMQAINREILRSLAIAIWFATVLVGGIATALAEERGLVLASTLVYAVGGILITGRGNVPLNEALDRVDPDGPEADAAWTRYRTLWSRWNAVRTVAMVVAAAGFALAV